MNNQEVYATANKFLRSRMTQEEIYQAGIDFFKNQKIDPPPDLSDAAVERMRRVAAISLQLEPLPPGNNDGLVYFSTRPWDAEPVLAIDTNGHEAFAEFMSNARSWVILLSSELLRIREGLAPVLEYKHFEVCSKVGGEQQDCDCHYWMVKEIMQSGE